MEDHRLRVLFLCTGNSARSQMAEALLRFLSKNRIAAFSAGSAPEGRVHALAKRTLQEKFGIDASDLYSKSMNEFIGDQFDYVITVCDRAAESCPAFPGAHPLELRGSSSCSRRRASTSRIRFSRKRISRASQDMDVIVRNQTPNGEVRSRRRT